MIKRLLNIIIIVIAITCVDAHFNKTYSQYREPSSDKHQKKRNKKNVGKKQLFGRNKTKKLISSQDPFVTKTKKAKKGNIQEPLFNKGNGKGKINEKDAFVSKSRKSKKYKKKKGKKRKQKVNPNRKVEQNQYAI